MIMKKNLQLLTVREREVLQLLSTGSTYEKIAVELDVSAETIKMHLKNIYRKLNVQNKIEALQKVKLL
jgi:DNA-binding CsgD family transcriptional regulator